MANSRNVSKVSREELAQASASLFGIPQKKSVPDKSQDQPKQRSYISKLTNKELKEFFSGFGYIAHQKYQDENGVDFTHVTCENFEVIFNDYDMAVICNPANTKSNSGFDYPAFLTYCDSVDLAPEQAIADIVTADFLTPRFPSYAEKRRKHKDAQARSAFESLPKAMRMKLKSINEKIAAENALMENKGKYGTFDAEEFLKTTYGEGQ